jgi:hypothetical protein
MDALRRAYASGGQGFDELLARVGAALVCPIFLIAAPEAADAPTSMLVIAAAGILALAGATLISVLDAPLRNPS